MVSNQTESQNIEVTDSPVKETGAGDVKTEKPIRRRVSTKTAEKKETEDKASSEKNLSEEKPSRTRASKHSEPAIEKIKDVKEPEPKLSSGVNILKEPEKNVQPHKPESNYRHNNHEIKKDSAPVNNLVVPQNSQNPPAPQPVVSPAPVQTFSTTNSSANNANNYNRPNPSSQPANNYNNNNYQQSMPQHQYVEVARGFTIQDLNKKTIAELFQIAQDMNVPPHIHKKQPNLIMRIMHEQIKRAGGYAAEGVLDILEDGYGFLRTATYSINEKDVYVSPSQIRRFDLRTGDIIIGQTRAPKEGEKFAALLRIEAINFEEPEKIKSRKSFDTLVPYYPNEKFVMEKKADYSDLSTRIVDLISPVGKGQRGLIVAPPKAGKTTLLKSIANSIIENHPEVEVMILLIDERPEEVTDMQRSVDAEVISSTFDEPLEHHIRVSELTLEKAKRMVENDKNVVILLDSITRLARAYNLQLPSSGQTLTGGVNPAALYKPKKFFGAARNIEGGGSLTILATALVETGSKLDDIIFEEFKGTGNMELILDRKLFEKRLFPCIDIKRTGTRKEELLLDKDTLNKVWILRKILEPLSPAEAMQLVVDRMSKTKKNKDFLESMHVSSEN